MNEIFETWCKSNPWAAARDRDIRVLTKNGVPVKAGTLCFGGEPVGKGREEVLVWQYKTLSRVFDLPCYVDDVPPLFRRAVCGKGQEWAEMNRLNSSALLSYLCFSNIQQHPLMIELPELGKVSFCNVDFEVGMKIDGCKGAPSMDVVLTSQDESVVLFIESKFTEYLTLSRSSKQPISANPIYLEAFRRYFPRGDVSIGDVTTKMRRSGRPWSYFKLRSRQPHYLDGLKQMTCHWLGLQNAKKARCYAGKRLVLLELLYDFGATDQLSDYKKMHGELTSRFVDESGITLAVHEVMTYQNVFHDYPLPRLVREFYGL